VHEFERADTCPFRRQRQPCLHGDRL